MEEAAKVCFDEILAQSTRPMLVAVTGDSGSGKSYLVALLEERFKAAAHNYTVIGNDDFLISRADREPMKSTYYTEGKFAGKSHWEILENMFRLEEFETVIDDLKAGKAATYYPYSRDTGTVSTEPKTVTPNEFIIFDTSMLLHKMDFVILVDVSQENIIKRKISRDSDIRTPEQIIEMHEKVQGYYWLDRGKPASPDIIINNNDFAAVTVAKTNK